MCKHQISIIFSFEIDENFKWTHCFKNGICYKLVNTVQNGSIKIPWLISACLRSSLASTYHLMIDTPTSSRWMNPLWKPLSHPFNGKRKYQKFTIFWKKKGNNFYSSVVPHVVSKFMAMTVIISVAKEARVDALMLIFPLANVIFITSVPCLRYSAQTTHISLQPHLKVVLNFEITHYPFINSF